MLQNLRVVGRVPYGLMAILLAGGLLFALGLSVSREGQALSPASGEWTVEESRWSAPVLQASDPMTVYLPLVAKRFPPPLPVFGVETNRGYVSATVTKAAEAKIWWVRYNGILWSEVEATQGTYNWSALADEEEELRTLTANGLAPMVIIRGTPGWAQKWEGYPCGPIKEDMLDDFANFVEAVVNRYKGEPYNIRYWEIWNEPDAHNYIPPNSPYGCWGDTTDSYYGGEYYAEMLKYVYPAIKRADPNAQVVLGGLLMWCDDEDPNPQPEIGDCPSAKFLEGILRNGGGAYFDIMAYHAYPYWAPGAVNVDWDLNQIHWDHRGGVLLGKLDFIRDKFAQYRVNKPIFMNEGGLMCYSDDNNNADCSSDNFRSAQANYAVRLFTRTWANGLLGSTWYTLNGPGWRQGGLLDGSQNPRPAYNALGFMAGLLKGAYYEHQLSGGDLEGYLFRNETTRREYRVYWKNDGNSVSVNLPQGAKVYDKVGNDITPPGGTVQVGFEPIFIESPIP